MFYRVNKAKWLRITEVLFCTVLKEQTVHLDMCFPPFGAMLVLN